MAEKNFILATAGHVDHGKSALVKALTGTDPDRLPEEKARGITIDLGFAELNLTGPHHEPYHVGIVDVPGHEDFVRNMIAGVGSVNLALLVVAADDGWMPQTEEHLQILTYLGVSRAVVALTKSDIADSEKTATEVREKLRGTPFENSSIVRTSFTGTNATGLIRQVSPEAITELKRTLVAELSQLEPARDIGKSRLFVDRAFTLRGIGTIATGTLIGGPLSREQSVVLQSQDLPTRVRSIQNHSRAVEIAVPGTRTALNLADVDIGQIDRGNVVSAADLGSSTDCLEAVIERSNRLLPDTPAARPIKNRSSLYLHHGTSRTTARIKLLERETLGPGERALAELRLSSPIFAFVGDRFILRDSSQQFTVGGGVVLARRGHIPTGREVLAKRASAPNDVDVYVETELAQLGFIESSDLLRQSNFGSAEISTAAQRLEKSGRTFMHNEIVADANYWNALIQKATRQIDDHHAQKPEQRGLELSELRTSLNAPTEKLFETVIEDLCRNGFERYGSVITRKSHRAALPAHLRAVSESIVATLSVKPFDPPSRREIVKTAQQQQAVRFLADQGDIVVIDDDVLLSREAASRMREIVRNFIGASGPATASQLRQTLGTSRRVLIPFLEHLDKAGVTQRAGDKRVLRENKTAGVAQK